MSGEPVTPPATRAEDAGRAQEIASLIDTLSASEKRLEQLTAGQVDAVLDRSGQAFVLQRAQEKLRIQEALKQAAILDALPAHIALIDVRGAIVSINTAWRKFAVESVLRGPDYGLGLNYLEVCDNAAGPDAALARRVATGIRAVLAGELQAFQAVYSCHSPTERRWFEMTVSPLSDIPPSGAVVVHQDISERTQAEESLQRSSQLLRAVAAGTPDQVFVKDAEGRYLLSNEAFARFSGRSVDEMIGQDSATIFGAERGRELSRADQLVMASGEPTLTEDVLVGAAGSRTFLVTKAPYRDQHGAVIGVIGISRDITQRKEAEEGLRKSQGLLGMAGRLAAVGAWFVDLPASKVYWSEVLNVIHEEPETFSPTVAEALGYYVAEHRGLITEAFEQCVSQGTPFDLELEILTTAGRRTWVRAIGEAVRDDQGVIRRVQGALQDLSERKLAERATRQLAYQLTNILESITDGFLTLDRDWCYTFINNEALRMLGRTREQLIGRNMWEEFPESIGTDFERGYRSAMQAEEGSSFEAFYEAWNAWVGVHCYPSETGLSIYFSDVTQRKHDQDALRELNADLEARVASRTAELTLAREDAEQANRAKSSFLAAMSHEIRTPMNGVVGMIDVLEQSHLKSGQAEIVKTVRESAYALLSIVDDVLDFSKIEAGHFQMDSEPLSIRRVIERACDTLSHLAEAKGVSLRVWIDPEIPGRVCGDAQRLRQVLLNLVGNAIKFSAGASGSGQASATGSAGRVDVRGRLVEIDEMLCAVEFAIVDNGIGMDEETLARLFTPFSQADDSTTRRFGGTGLGLSISSRLAGLMGGKIEVASEPGRGSSFTMQLPFRWLERGPEAPDEPSAFADSGPDTFPGADGETVPMPLSVVEEGGRLILVAEDNEINQKVIRKQLALLGFSTHMAANGREALDRARHGRYSMLLTDLHMPLMDGYALTAAIRREENVGVRMPIVALTANALKGEAKRCRELGMDDYMTKPLQLADLHSMLTRWMPVEARPAPLRETRSTVSRIPAFSDDGVQPVLMAAVDLDVLRRLVGDDPLVIAEMLRAFRKSSERLGEAVRLGAATADRKGVGDAVHSLKSAARSIGARRLGNICEEIEASSDAERPVGMAGQLARFEHELADVHRTLDAL